jgi:hypothetical protein
MPLYDELPVFKASYDLLLDIFQFTANFGKSWSSEHLIPVLTEHAISVSSATI